MNRKLIIGASVVVLLAGAGLVAALRGGLGAPAEPTPVATTAPAEEQVVAAAKVVPARAAELSFPSGGVVAEVLVAEGATVRAGQALARLDAAALQARLARAEAQLLSARASLRLLNEGPSVEQLAAAEAGVRQAQAQLRLTLVAVSPDDIRAAEAQIKAAQALVNRLQSGAANPDVRAAQAGLAQAQAGLAGQRAQLSAGKTSAELQLAQAAELLVQAQTAYSTARWNWEYVQANGTDPNQPTRTDASGKTKANRLNETQRQQYHDAFVAAEAGLHGAEAGVRQAQVAYDGARQGEIEGIQAAEQQLAAAQITLDRVSGVGQSEDLAQARAQLALAQSSLGQLSGPRREQQIAAAQAALDAAQAGLVLLKAAPRESERLAAEAQVAAAAAEADAARADLAQAVLAAPFAGVVAGLELRAGEYVVPGAPVAQLADPAEWLIETTDLTELSIAQVGAGSPATITFDALPGSELRGLVLRVAGFGQTRQGDIIYKAVIKPEQPDARMRWNMTATVSISATRSADAP